MYAKLVTASVIAGIIAVLSLVVKTQYDTIQEQKRTISTYELTVKLESIGSHADGQIESITRSENEENNESNNSDDDSIYVDFDWLF